VSCRRPLKATLQLRDRTPDTKDQLTWKWLRGAITAKADFRSPAATDRYDVCLYATGGLKLAARVPAGGVCAKGKPCWKEVSPGFTYRDNDLTPDGVQQLVLRQGLEAGKAKITLKGKGELLPMPALGTLTSPVTVQLVNRRTGTCWEAVYSAPFLEQDDTQFLDRAE